MMDDSRLTLLRGPCLLYTEVPPGQLESGDSWGEDRAVTRNVHEYLFENVLVRPDVQLSDLLTLGRDNAALHAVFRRYGSRATAHFVEKAIADGTIPASSEVEYLEIVPKDGWVDLRPVEFANADGARGIPEWDSFDLLTLLSMRLKMSERDKPRNPVLPPAVAEKEPHLVKLGGVLRTAYFMAQEKIPRLDSSSRHEDSWESDADFSEDFPLDDGGGLAADPNYNHDNGPDPWSPDGR